MNFTILFCLGMLFGLCGIAEAKQLDETAKQLDETKFAKLHEQINLQDEAWKAIPWKTDLLHAQNLAAQSKKPLFIWAMDGNPLTCT